MAKTELLQLLLGDVEEWNRRRKENPDALPDLVGADLVGADLSEADLNRANLSLANIRGANLNRANLSGANLTNVNASRANFFKADLSLANLYMADLGLANFSFANLDNANLSQARVAYTSFGHVDLSDVLGLETVKHKAPSSIGIDTVYRSKGKIPHLFLRGAGVPENFIEYMASLVGTGIEFYSLFISYSTNDQEFANRLHADLQDKGVRCWFAPHDMRGGKKVHEQIDEAIRLHDKLLLILSPASIDSEWVKTEISKARKREIQEGLRVLFPIRLCSFERLRDWECFDADAGKDSARELREYFIPDFSDWKDHDRYQKAFNRLLGDLQGKQPLTSA